MIMKKLYSLTSFFSFLTGLFSSCNIQTIPGNGDVANKVIPIEDYNTIQISAGNIDLKYTQSDESAPFLSIETDQNIHDILEIKSSNNELTIHPREGQIKISPTLFIVTTNSTALKELCMEGSGNCDLGNGLNGENLTIKLAGTGTVKADSIDITNLDCKIAGSSTLCLSGRAKAMNIESAGNSEVKSFDLETEDLNCSAAGKTQIEITANKTISAKIAGSGTIHYKGNPEIKHKDIAGIGSITKTD